MSEKWSLGKEQRWNLKQFSAWVALFHIKNIKFIIPVVTATVTVTANFFRRHCNCHCHWKFFSQSLSLSLCTEFAVTVTRHCSVQKPLIPVKNTKYVRILFESCKGSPKVSVDIFWAIGDFLEAQKSDFSGKIVQKLVNSSGPFPWLVPAVIWGSVFNNHG